MEKKDPEVSLANPGLPAKWLLKRHMCASGGISDLNLLRCFLEGHVKPS